MRLIDADAAIEAVEFGITYAKAIDTKTGEVRELFKQSNEELRKAVERIKQLPPAEPEAISKWKKEFREYVDSLNIARDDWKGIIEYIDELPSMQPDLGKYEYHYDHTDCVWYRPEARNRCPVTCAQYRDGWNDAMNYIFRDGKGYRPYRRGEQYEG